MVQKRKERQKNGDVSFCSRTWLELQKVLLMFALLLKHLMGLGLMLIYLNFL